MRLNSEPTKVVPKASAEDEALLDCEACFSLKLKKVKVEPKLRFFVYVLLVTLFSQNHLLLAFREAFSLILGE
jgi:hypothetical protein